MTNYHYNKIPQSTEKKAKNISLAHGKYLKIKKAPSGANITVRIGSVTNSAIGLEQGEKITLKESDEFFISYDQVPNGMIEFIVSDLKDFDLEDSNKIERVEEVIGFGVEAKKILQILPSEIQSKEIKPNEYLVLDISDIEGIKYFTDTPLKMAFSGNGGKYPIIENKEHETFCQLLGNSIKFYNEAATTANISFQIMGTSKIKKLSYVQAGYVQTGYIF